MGVCPCVCKKSDQTAEIITETKEVKQDTQSKTVLAVIKEEDSVVVNQSIENIPIIEEKLESFKTDPISLQKLQACFRGYLDRKLYVSRTENSIDSKNDSEKSDINTNYQEAPVVEIETHLVPVDFQVDYSLVPETFLNPTVRKKLQELGNFEFGEPTGKEFRPLFALIEGSLYQGEIDINEFPCGKGAIFYTDQNVYEGEWLSGKFHGNGRMVTSEGDIYMGQFIDNQLTGRGKKIFQNGNSYEGELLNSIPNGYGEEYMADGSYYKGFYKNGLKNGKGHYVWPEGSSYEGEFNEDKIEGFGKYIWPDKVYEGEWKDSIQHGEGVFSWNDGKKYKGGYFMGKKQGFGVFEWPDGKKFEGNWLDGKQEGQGVFWKGGKIKQQGVWKEGKYIGKEEN